MKKFFVPLFLALALAFGIAAPAAAAPVPTAKAACVQNQYPISQGIGLTFVSSVWYYYTDVLAKSNGCPNVYVGNLIYKGGAGSAYVAEYDHQGLAPRHLIGQNGPKVEIEINNVPGSTFQILSTRQIIAGYDQR